MSRTSMPCPKSSGFLSTRKGSPGGSALSWTRTAIGCALPPGARDHERPRDGGDRRLVGGCAGGSRSEAGKPLGGTGSVESPGGLATVGDAREPGGVGSPEQLRPLAFEVAGLVDGGVGRGG